MLPLLKSLRLGLGIVALLVLAVLAWSVVVIYRDGSTWAIPGLAAVNLHGIAYVEPEVARAYNASGIIAWVVVVLMIGVSAVIQHIERRRR